LEKGREQHKSVGGTIVWKAVTLEREGKKMDIEE